MLALIQVQVIANPLSKKPYIYHHYIDETDSLLIDSRTDLERGGGGNIVPKRIFKRAPMTFTFDLET